MLKKDIVGVVVFALVCSGCNKIKERFGAAMEEKVTKAKTFEATASLGRISKNMIDSASTHMMAGRTFKVCEDMEATLPGDGPGKEKRPGAYSRGWKDIGFEPESTFYSYSAKRKIGPNGNNICEIVAEGNLDGDDTYSYFTQVLDISSDNQLKLSGDVVIENELE